MEHEALLKYLREQLAERDAYLAKYEEARAEFEAVKVAYEEAVRKVQSFGDVSKIVADKEYVQALIAQYEVKDEVVAEPEVVAEQVTMDGTVTV